MSETLRSQLTSALAQDNLHSTVSEAKLRAAGAGVDYEQFRDIVAAAHLKPVNLRSHDGQSASSRSTDIVSTLHEQLRILGVKSIDLFVPAQKVPEPKLTETRAAPAKPDSILSSSASPAPSKQPPQTQPLQTLPTRQSSQPTPSVIASASSASSALGASKAFARAVSDESKSANQQRPSMEVPDPSGSGASHNVLAPQTPHDFERDWNRFCVTTTIQYRYLQLIQPSSLVAVFKNNAGLSTLGKIVGAFAAEFRPEDAPFIISFLHNMSQLKRFSMSAEFMSEEERIWARSLFQKLSDLTPPPCSPEQLSKLKEAYLVS